MEGSEKKKGIIGNKDNAGNIKILQRNYSIIRETLYS